MSVTNIVINAKNAKDGSACEIEVPVSCDVRLVRNGRYGLKAIARIEYMGVLINDILVSERRGELTVRYPYRRIERNNETRAATIVFPTIRELGTKFNHIIQSEYTKAVLNNSDSDVLSVIGDESDKSEAA